MAKSKAFSVEMLEKMKQEGKISGYNLTQTKPKEKPKQSKYRNKKVVMDFGDEIVKFDSQKEAKRFGELLIESRQGFISNLQRQVKYPLMVKGQPICMYIADFTYTDKNGIDVVEDVKGKYTDKRGKIKYRTTAEYRIKEKMMMAIYGIKITKV
jgi:hypothetical protein